MLERGLISLFRPGLTLLRPTYTSTPPRLIRERCQRWYSLHPEQNVEKLQELDATQLQITKTTTPKQLTPPKDLVFGRTFTGTRSTSIINASLGLHMKCLLQQELTEYVRPHALHRMDRFHWLAHASNNALPKPLSRPGNLCLPLRLRVLRGHEGLQGLAEPNSPFPPG